MLDQTAEELAPQHGIDPATAKVLATAVVEDVAEKQIRDALRRSKRRGEAGVIAIGGGKSRVKIAEGDVRAVVSWLLGRIK